MFCTSYEGQGRSSQGNAGTSHQWRTGYWISRFFYKTQDNVARICRVILRWCKWWRINQMKNDKLISAFFYFREQKIIKYMHYFKENFKSSVQSCHYLYWFLSGDKTRMQNVIIFPRGQTLFIYLNWLCCMEYYRTVQYSYVWHPCISTSTQVVILMINTAESSKSFGKKTQKPKPWKKLHRGSGRTLLGSSLKVMWTFKFFLKGKEVPHIYK